MLLLSESRVSISVHDFVGTLNRFTLSRTSTLLLRLTNIAIDISVSQLQNQISKLEGKTSITSIRYHLPQFIIAYFLSKEADYTQKLLTYKEENYNWMHLYNSLFCNLSNHNKKYALQAQPYHKSTCLDICVSSKS